MKKFAFALAIVFLLEEHARARIGDTPEQLQQRYGAPLKESFDQRGYGAGIYQANGFKEIRVTFVKGKSHLEVYEITGDRPVQDSVVEMLKQENPGESVLALSNQVRVGAEESESELKFVTHSNQEHTYWGTPKYRQDGETRTLVLHDGETVIEIPLRRPDTGLNDLNPDTRYSITVLDENSENLESQIAIVSRREHVDWNDAVDEAHSSFQQLVRLSVDNKTIFDHSICSLHHVKMERRNVEIVYGMLAYSKAESYCIAHYPNFRDYAVGGCLVGDTKSTSIYICPKCVAECDEYKRQHPAENKNSLN